MSTLKPLCVFDLCDDIMGMILIELLPRQRYNRVVAEYKDPRFHKGAARVLKAMERSYSADRSHPGRTYLRVIHPVLTSWPHYPIADFKCKAINIYGLRIKTQPRSGWAYQQHLDWSCKGSVRDFTHDDLDRILAELGKQRFKSKLKHDKIAMLMKHESAQKTFSA